MNEIFTKACQNNLLKLVQNCIKAGADVHADNDSALRWASRYGHAAMVKLLLEAGADVHANNDQALHWASRYGHAAVVTLLLEAGADVHANNDYALHWASGERSCCCGHAFKRIA